ncbi:MAG: proton-conducting transporter membrane subunit [Pseudomonadota bacterium]
METIASGQPWIIWAVFSPLVGAIFAFLLPRHASLVGCLAALATSGAILGLVRQVVEFGPQRYLLGGWGAPLGVDLQADGLSVVMLLTAGVVGAGVTVYATGYFQRSSQAARAFWPLWLWLWTAMNALFLSADIFNLYVTLELLSLSAVALVAVSGNADALTGAMRYLLVSLLGSLSYLFGVVLFYGAHGTLDIALLGDLTGPSPADWVATGLMITGLAIKSALFPLHFWLPPAHAAAPAPVSALLSALVVKASFYLLLRLWLDVFPVSTPVAGQLLGVLGAAAIVWGSLKALRQKRLKLLVAYSTVAQLGYLFLAFPLASTLAAATAWSGSVMFIVSHALAKTAMFLAAGNILRSVGHDRIAELGGAQRSATLSWIAFAIAGISIMGLPPSGGFTAKWVMLQAAFASGQWWWSMPIIGGGLLAAAYVFRIVALAFAPIGAPGTSKSVPKRMELAALGFAVAAVMAGFATLQILSLLDSGAPFGQIGAEAVL